jgi:predicted ribosomally synthesized peptide with nif11-like leader
MSEDQIKSFLAKAQGDPALMAKIKGAKDHTALSEVAKAAGFNLSPDAFDSLGGGSVSEDELEAVQGGTVLSAVVWTVYVAK